MSWDAIITRGEAGEEPIGPCAEVGQWLTDFWQVTDWGRFVSEDGCRFELMLRTALDEAKWEFLDTHPTPSDPAQLPDYRKAIRHLHLHRTRSAWPQRSAHASPVHSTPPSP
jgi:hypothetical protein